MKSNLRETLAASTLDEATESSGPVWIGVVLGLVAAILYSLKAVFVKLAYLPSGGVTEQIPPGEQSKNQRRGRLVWRC